MSEIELSVHNVRNKGKEEAFTNQIIISQLFQQEDTIMGENVRI